MSEQEAFYDSLPEIVAQGQSALAFTRDKHFARPNANPEVTRMSRFLIWVIWQHYIAPISPSNVVFSTDDRGHYLNMADMLKALNGRGAGHLSERSSDGTDAPSQFWRLLHEPCRILRIPVDIFVVILLRFASHPGEKPRAYDIMDGEGVGALARKIALERDIIIPRAFRYFRQAEDDWITKAVMLSRLDRIQQLYFSELVIYRTGPPRTPFASTMDFESGKELEVLYKLSCRGERMHGYSIGQEKRQEGQEARQKHAPVDDCSGQWSRPDDWVGKLGRFLWRTSLQTAVHGGQPFQRAAKAEIEKKQLN